MSRKKVKIANNQTINEVVKFISYFKSAEDAALHLEISGAMMFYLKHGYQKPSEKLAVRMCELVIEKRRSIKPLNLKKLLLPKIN